MTTTKRQKPLCVIQARMGSKRLPGKVLLEVGSIPMLHYQVNRVQQSQGLDTIVVATSTHGENDRIEALCKEIGVACFRGSEEDVLDRFYQCSRLYSDHDVIMRLTGDCPLVDPHIIDDTILLFQKGGYDYVQSTQLEGGKFPDGMDVELFTSALLHEAAKEASLPSEREHVTQYMNNSSHVKKGALGAPQDFSHIRLTVDEPEDLEVIRFLIDHSSPHATYLDYVATLANRPEIAKINMHIEKNEGLKRSLSSDNAL
jgi:spore coat polysaccharide biosynthesis protein SpsF (cytidylyltransferase family)